MKHKLLSILLSLSLVISLLPTVALAAEGTTEVKFTPQGGSKVAYMKAEDASGNITLYFYSEKDVTEYATASYELDGKIVTFKGATLRSVNNLMRAYWEVCKNTTGCDYNSAMLPANGSGTLTWTIYGQVEQGDYLRSNNGEGALILPALSGGYIWGTDGGYNWKNIAVNADTENATIVSSTTFDDGHSYISTGTDTTTFTGITLKGGLYVHPAGTLTFDDCTFTGQLRVPNGDGKTIIKNSAFNGTTAAQDTNGYVLHYQASGELEFTSNTIASYKRGLNIDHEGLTAKISDNTIAPVTDTGRSAIQITKVVNLDVDSNKIELNGGNAITLHENLLKLTTAPAISITGNNITGTGYLIYDDAAASGKSFTSDKLTLTMGTGESANTIASTVDTTNGVKGGKETALTGYVAEALDPVAAINGKGYATLAEAIDKAENNDTITLLKDVDENVTIPAGKTITLDLNGKTLVNSETAQDKNSSESERKHTITNNGTLTIKDSVGGGIVDNVSHACAAIKNNVGGTVTIENGTFCRTAEASTGADNSGGNSYYVIDNQGTMNINGGTFKFSDENDGAYSSLIHNGWYDGTKNTQKAPAKMTITDGSFTQGTGGKITVKNDEYGELKIQGGTFTQPQAGYYCVLNWNKAEITGGTINGPVGCGADATVEAAKGSLTIGGTVRINGAVLKATSNAGISISGGNFANSVKDYVVSDLTAELKKASGETPYSYYTSVAAATAAAQPGDTVTDLKASTEQKVTLTLKYNDGATADTTYNVASGTTITLPTPTRSGYTFNGWYDGSTKVSSSYEVTKNVILTASWSYISSGSSGSYDPTYSVSTPSKTEHGSVTVSPKSASKGDTVTITVKPDSGYELETITVTDKNGNELTLKDKGDGKYTFTMPAGKVEVKATFMEDNSVLNFFYDVPNNAYFYEAVKWAVENGITTGVGNDLFAPEQPCTRAQIVTFLWRAAGSPEPKGVASGMTDVVSGSYYEKAVAWAIENGVTTGTTASTFSPDATCTRAQAVTFLARALNAKASGKAEFNDVPADSYFAEAVAWAAANGVTEGIGNGLFGSDNDCTRGQIVTFLYRAYNK